MVSFLKIAAALVALLPGTTVAYQDSCYYGDVMALDKELCYCGLLKIDPAKHYDSGAEFSFDTCYMAYNPGTGDPYVISGKDIIQTAYRILDECEQYGTYGTGTCDDCFVRIEHKWETDGEYDPWPKAYDPPKSMEWVGEGPPPTSSPAKPSASTYSV